jgi:WD40 repeat protein
MITLRERSLLLSTLVLASLSLLASAEAPARPIQTSSRVHISTPFPAIGWPMYVKVDRRTPHIRGQPVVSKPASIDWGDGTHSKIGSHRSKARHTYGAPTPRVITVKLPGTHPGTPRVTKFKVTPGPAPTRSRHLLQIALGVDLLSLGPRDALGPSTAVFSPVMSADGDHVAYGYTGVGADYGLRWRDLKSGRLRIYYGRGNNPAALDMSGDGRFVVLAAATKVASNGQVKGEGVFVLDTRNGNRSRIDRLPSGKAPNDGIINRISVSPDGRWITFDSTSPTLAPPGAVKESTSLAGPAYVYLYDRASRKLRSVPDVSLFGHPAYLRGPVVSGDGQVVAFHDDGDGMHVDVWHPATGEVRHVSALDATGGTNAPESLALSADGTTLANRAFGLTIVRLGPSEATDLVEYSDGSQGDTGDTQSMALSADGSTVAYFAGSAPDGSGDSAVWRLDLPGGAPVRLDAPTTVYGLEPEQGRVMGMGGNRVTISSDGSQVAAAACTLGIKRSQVGAPCVARVDVLRWTRDQPASAASSTK